jgi:hypothetical protein
MHHRVPKHVDLTGLGKIGPSGHGVEGGSIGDEQCPPEAGRARCERLTRRRAPFRSIACPATVRHSHGGKRSLTYFSRGLLSFGERKVFDTKKKF